jgi:hypothetical protein
LTLIVDLAVDEEDDDVAVTAVSLIVLTVGDSLG